MKIFILFFLMGTTVGVLAQQDQASIQKTNGVTLAKSDPAETKTQPVVRLRCRSTMPDSSILYLLDGVVVTNEVFKTINPAKITSIEILKGHKASALFGCLGVNGVVIITTRSRTATLQFVDAETGTEVPNVTLVAIGGKYWQDTVMSTSDSLGKVKMSLDQLKNYNIIVTSVGYQTKKFNVALAADSLISIHLDRDIKMGDTAIVTGNGRHLICRYFTKSISIFNTKASNAFALKKLPTFYPNPVLRGHEFNIELPNETKSNTVLNILDMQGRLLATQRIPDNLQFKTIKLTANARWTPGTYLLQITSPGQSSTTKFLIQ
jgi:TonB-dependent SusC/RagA subfamily outer membrane receptor